MAGDSVVETPASSMRSSLALLIVSWLWVGAPLAWGVLQTLKTSMPLFR